MALIMESDTCGNPTDRSVTVTKQRYAFDKATLANPLTNGAPEPTAKCAAEVPRVNARDAGQLE